jgi:hypothetical protein
METSAAQQIDANRRTINSNDAFLLSSTWTFAAATTGAVGAHTLFTVTGDVLANVFAVCSTDVTGSGTGEVGVTGNTAALIAQTTGTAIDAGEVWQNNTPTVGIGAVVSTPKPITNGLDIILTIGTNTFTAGVVTFYCLWRPLSSTGDVTVTTPA